jgi:hypothetical protein
LEMIVDWIEGVTPALAPGASVARSVSDEAIPSMTSEIASWREAPLAMTWMNL